MEGLRRVHILREAISLGLFDRLAMAKDHEELAKELGLDEGMTDLFCESLRSIGLLERDGTGKYRNSALAATYLVRGSPYAQERSLNWTWLGMERWQELDNYLRNGPKMIDRTEFFNEDWIRSIAERAICGGVQKVANDIADLVDMTGGKRLLDLGGGHGLYAAAFCARVPGLRAVVFDLPEMVPLTKRYLERYGADRVEVAGGDFTKDDIGSGFDMIFSSYNASGSDLSMVPVVTAALRAGGYLVLRQFSEEAKCEPVAGLEWNFVSFRGMRRGKRRFSGPNSCSLRSTAGRWRKRASR